MYESCKEFRGTKLCLGALARSRDLDVEAKHPKGLFLVSDLNERWEAHGP